MPREWVFIGKSLTPENHLGLEWVKRWMEATVMKNINFVSIREDTEQGQSHAFTPGTGEPGTELFHIFLIATCFGTILKY